MTEDISGAPQTYTSTATSDSFGRVLSQTYPSGEVLTYGYNAMGALETLSGTNTYVSGVDYKESGQVTATYLGNGIISQACYQDNNLRLTQIRAYGGAFVGCGTTPSSPLLNLQYSQYDNIGNVKQVTDVVRGETMNYAYDDLDRLLSVSNAYSQTFAYTVLGNFTSKAGVSHTYNAPSPASGCASGTPTTKPHAVQQAGSDTFAYDCNGNMTTRTEGGITYNQVFDVENRLTHVYDITSGSPGTLLVSFIYDGDGNLIKKFDSTGVTLYIGGVYELHFDTNSQLDKTTSYYPVGGAMRIIDGTGNNLYYMLKDHLGSASVLLDSSGGPVTNGEQRYYPFGESRIANGDVKTDQLFTGQRQVANIGLYHYGARMYDPKIGRFVSADTIVPNFANPQSLNRFSYVYNNPVNNVDPSGHTPQACSGTDAFISETNGDGGISEASCWARQRDNNVLMGAGLSSSNSNTISTALDTLGSDGVLNILSGIQQGRDPDDYIGGWDVTITLDVWFDIDKEIEERIARLEFMYDKIGESGGFIISLVTARVAPVGLGGKVITFFLADVAAEKIIAGLAKEIEGGVYRLEKLRNLLSESAQNAIRDGSSSFTVYIYQYYPDYALVVNSDQSTMQIEYSANYLSQLEDLVINQGSAIFVPPVPAICKVTVCSTTPTP